MYGPPPFWRLKRWSVFAINFAGINALVANTVSTAVAQEADTTSPTITAVASAPPNANGWYRTSVRVRFVCADPGGSGIASFPAAQTLTTEGAGQGVSGVTRDHAGNTASTSLSLSIDKTPPIVTAARTPEAGANGWVRTPVTVTFAASDALSGVVPESVTPPITYSTDRSNTTATGRATDLARNVGSVQLTGIKIDTAKPKITVSLLPGQTGSGWRNAPVTAHFTCTDTGSGIASCPADQFFPNEGRGQTVTGTSTDNVGLSATVTATFHIDLTPPTVTTTFSRPPDVNGWYTSPVTASFLCTNALSGIYARPEPLVISVEGANQPLAVTALDRARNATAPSERVSLDLTPPTLVITSPATSIEVASASFTITGSATDVAAGIAGVTIGGAPVSLQTDGSFAFPVSLTEGVNSFAVVATDHVGRSSSQTVMLTRTTPLSPPAGADQLDHRRAVRVGRLGLFRAGCQQLGFTVG
ncbi:MAG: hypothetical protein EXS36_04745 [Pedosphaera sp.]|nr:hypothetical protein [Pedosphaera sp.]